MPRGPGRPRTIDDETVLLAALRAFAAQGYDGMSVRTLNAGLNISHNTLHQRFGSKEGLWKAAVEHGFKRLRDALFKALAEVDNTKASDRYLLVYREARHNVAGNAIPDAQSAFYYGIS